MQPLFSTNASANWSASNAPRSSGAQWLVNGLLSITTRLDRAARRLDARQQLAKLDVRMLDDIGLTMAERDRLV